MNKMENKSLVEKPTKQSETVAHEKPIMWLTEKRKNSNNIHKMMT